jgi:uncharacterized membrane protein YcjF (UPF0283 family)
VAATTTRHRPRLRRMLVGAGVTLVSFAAVLTATILLVGRLSSLDRISAVGGVTVFVFALSAWLVVITAGWLRWLR